MKDIPDAPATFRPIDVTGFKPATVEDQPQPMLIWADIDLLEVSATGDDEAEAVANWIRAVRRMEEAGGMAA